MNITVNNCFLPTEDHEKAISFYRDAMGLEVRSDVAYGGLRWVTVGSSAQPDVNIVLYPPAGDPNASAADRKALVELMAKGFFSVHFAAADVDAAFEQVKDAGGEVLQEPTDMPYGKRDCAFRDPSGNMLRISQS